MRWLLVVFVVCIALPSFVWSWAEPSATYRDIVNYSHGDVSNLSGWQVNVTIDTATLIAQGKMNGSTCAVRFYDDDDTTKLPYWLDVDTCNTSSTLYYVKLVDNGTWGYIYYDIDLTDESNGSAVFEFYDDFNDNSLDSSKWGISSPAPAGAFVNETGGTLQIHMRIFPYTLRNFTEPVVMEYDAMIDADSYFHFGLIRFDGVQCDNFYYSASNGYYIVAPQGNRFFESVACNKAFSTLFISIGLNSWFKISVYDGKDVYNTKYYINGTLYVNSLNATLFTYNYLSPGGGLEVDTPSTNLYVDNFRVRLYADPEPFGTLSGNEETQPVSTDTSFKIEMPNGVNYTSTTAYPPNVSTASIEFNFTSVPQTDCPACIVGTTTCQNDTTPIMRFWNTGNVVESWYVKVNETLPTGITLKFSTTYSGTRTAISTSWVLVATVPANGYQDLWLWADIAQGTAPGTSVRDIYHNATG